MEQEQKISKLKTLLLETEKKSESQNLQHKQDLNSLFSDYVLGDGQPLDLFAQSPAEIGFAKSEQVVNTLEWAKGI